MERTEPLVAVLRQARMSRQRLVLATLVQAEGPAYFREGAHLVVHENAEWDGLISGGCLEPEVARTAGEVFDTGKPRLEQFDLRDESPWGLNIGCGGIIDIFLETIRGDPVWREWENRLASSLPVVRVVEYQNNEREARGTVSTITLDQDFWDKRIDVEVRSFLTVHARELLGDRNNQSKTVSSTEGSYLLDLFQPPQQLFIFGAGDDAIPVAQLASRLGFSVTVVDPRSEYLTESRFPRADRILADNDLSRKITLTEESLVLIMNHHLERDARALHLLLESQVAYIGLLGPRSRLDRLFRQLKSLDLSVTEEAAARIHNPVGLDVGAKGPWEIAVSILAEILAVVRKRKGGFLTPSMKVDV